MRSRRIVLASTSRYRRELLSRLGLAFDVVAPGVEESALPHETPAATASRLAEAKARAVAATERDAVVIGADQVADCDGAAVSKPVDHDDARRMLAWLAGRTVVFHTAVAVVDATTGQLQRDRVDVASTFRSLSMREIDAYLDRERPYDCAGAVRSEALGIVLFERIASDDPTALIGLPLIAVARMLRHAGVDPLAAP
jgi:septum formation protein